MAAGQETTNIHGHNNGSTLCPNSELLDEMFVEQKVIPLYCGKKRKCGAFLGVITDDGQCLRIQNATFWRITYLTCKCGWAFRWMPANIDKDLDLIDENLTEFDLI
ncbi:MAG: hypothetical protein DCC44_10505 [Acidobacteria bacterium]|nr:MAG: hypothetical protein DCC44_10505 [Acidobacteriota bacterium]